MSLSLGVLILLCPASSPFLSWNCLLVWPEMFHPKLPSSRGILWPHMPGVGLSLEDPTMHFYWLEHFSPPFLTGICTAQGRENLASTRPPFIMLRILISLR